MLDVALLMANSSQLKTVLYVGPRYRFYIPLIVLLSLSICLQVAVGLLLVFIVSNTHETPKLNRMNNVATVFVFFTVLINIFITYKYNIKTFRCIRNSLPLEAALTYFNSMIMSRFYTA
uniref:Uncharacterized protein n=1 Tax=Salarias fasciatus TaxID=181472 RepID=A0A672F663_SALFA